MSLLMLLLGCAGGPDTADTALPGVCDSEQAQVTLVMRAMAFGEKEGDVAWGEDLDDHVTASGDSAGCGKPDLVDPEGQQGIDNALAWLLPAIENTEAVAIFGLLQNAIDDGELLLVVELSGVDDNIDDDCVTVTVTFAEGDPLMGTDGWMLDGQSFGRGAREPLVMVGALEDGVLVAPGLEMLLQLSLLDAELELGVEQGALRVELAEDGQSASGFIAGAVSIDYIMEIVDANPIDDELTELLRDLLPLTADITDETGECSLLSVAIEYDAVPSFFYGE